MTLLKHTKNTHENEKLGNPFAQAFSSKSFYSSVFLNKSVWFFTRIQRSTWNMESDCRHSNPFLWRYDVGKTTLKILTLVSGNTTHIFWVDFAYIKKGWSQLIDFYNVSANIYQHTIYIFVGKGVIIWMQKYKHRHKPNDLAFQECDNFW